MKISTPISSLAAQRSLATTAKALSRALEHLASGNRINSAREDASGLAVANKLESQVRGLGRASQNINESFGMLQTASGAISSQINIIQRMRELTVQSANGTLSSNDRSQLNAELQQLFSEYQRITDKTNFNGVNLLDGSFGTKSLQVGSKSGDTVDMGVASTQARDIFTVDATVYQTQGTYASGVNYSAAVNSSVGRLADMDGDGNLDMISFEGANFSIRLGEGDGTFASTTTRFTSNLDPNYGIFKIADMDGDGKNDIVGVDSIGKKLIIYKNLGNLQFSQTTYATESYCFSFEVADYNGDGKLDVVTADNNQFTSYGISTFLGNGDGTFQTRVTASVTSNSSLYLASADFDGDGVSDLIVGRLSGGRAYIETMKYNGAGLFTNIASKDLGASTGISNIAVGDLNANGAEDLSIYFSAGGGARNTITMLGSGTGSFAAPVTDATLVGINISDQQLVDLNNDGKLDRLFGKFGSWPTPSYITYQLGNGDGTFGVLTNIDAVSAFNLSTGDLNGDGFLDVLVSGTSSNFTGIYLQNTTAFPATESYVPYVNISTQSSAQDLIEVLDTALTNLNSAQSRLGAVQSRLESSLSNALITKENLAQARSQMLDTDVASETAELMRAQILQQAQVSVLGQANLSLQATLALLKF
ncbi:MAG: VCBS repeat-containing protein [Deltaproteobacteria bacterium]|nr:VCBS repeat-containing protein [Deltaproteobacteria bacterium]